MKLVCQLNSSGVFVGMVQAQESPLEPGIYLIPGGAVDSPQPEIPTNHYAQWNGAGFDILEIPPEFEPEPEPATELEPYKPVAVSMRQARLALLAAGHLDTVESAMAMQPKAAQIEWEYATEVQRNSPLTTAMAAVLELSEAQLDELFTQASEL